MFGVQKYRYSGICEHYSIIVWKCKVGVGEEVGREGKTEDGSRDGRRDGSRDGRRDVRRDGRGYGREDFEVAHDLERCIVK